MLSSSAELLQVSSQTAASAAVTWTAEVSTESETATVTECIFNKKRLVSLTNFTQVAFIYYPAYVPGQVFKAENTPTNAMNCNTSSRT